MQAASGLDHPVPPGTAESKTMPHSWVAMPMLAFCSLLRAGAAAEGGLQQHFHIRGRTCELSACLADKPQELKTYLTEPRDLQMASISSKMITCRSEFSPMAS